MHLSCSDVAYGDRRAGIEPAAADEYLVPAFGLDLPGPDHPAARSITIEQRSIVGLEACARENRHRRFDLRGRGVLADGRVVGRVHVGVREARVAGTAVGKGVVDELDVAD